MLTIKGAQKLGHGTGYKYAHDYPHHYVEQQYLPDEIAGEKFYVPSENGHEREIKRVDAVYSEESVIPGCYY